MIQLLNLLLTLSPLITYAIFILALRRGYLVAHRPSIVPRRADGSPRVAIITGATSGVGLALACELAALGVRVVIGYRSRARGERALERVKVSDRGSFAQAWTPMPHQIDDRAPPSPESPSFAAMRSDLPGSEVLSPNFCSSTSPTWTPFAQLCGTCKIDSTAWTGSF